MAKVEIEIPLNWELSKNKKFIGRTKKILNPKYKACKDEIYYLVVDQIVKNKVIFTKNKIWVIIQVYKGLRGDCHNLIEGVLDALKIALQIDDNYFAVVCDYQISKDKKVVVKIGQEIDILSEVKIIYDELC